MFSRSQALLAPLRRTKDPLLSSSVAQHFILPSGNHFIIRPPPSVVPPTVPISSTSTESGTHPFLESIVASPLNPSSSSISSSSSPIDPSQLPSSRSSRRFAPPPSSTRLSSEQITQLHELRRTNSSASRSQLAKQFGISPQAVGRMGYGKGSEARLAEKVKRGEIELEREEREASWGWKKSIAREERRRRREMW
ncbi:mitochondrial 54S ribosomal protein mL58 MRPL20 [Sporobolomyces salmoneus]|uniref:mitochondrial 54S ribosomal protein mL58 MRPL20 n=1 Tax=Sporobolomyces salmoneus TaxID=183962 RepID=UPI00316B25A8